ncbi:hypothetical protein Tco_0806103 [Tanacetum coccineum]
MNSLLSSSSSPYSTMNSTNAFSSNPSKKIKLTIIPHRQLFVNISSDEKLNLSSKVAFVAALLTVFSNCAYLPGLAFLLISSSLFGLNLLIRENPKLENESYVLYDRVMTPLAAQLEQKTRRDLGTRRGRHSTSSSSAFDQLTLSHLNDDNDDGNDEGTSRASTPSPIRYVNSLTNQIPQVFQNPPNVDQNMEPFYTRQTKILNSQVQLRDEQRGGVRSIRKKP